MNNIFSIRESGSIKESDAALLSISNLASMEQATQIMVQLVLSTGKKVRAQFIGSLPGGEGETIDMKYQDWVMTLEEANLFVEDKRKSAMNNLPEDVKKDLAAVLVEIDNVNAQISQKLKK